MCAALVVTVQPDTTFDESTSPSCRDAVQSSLGGAIARKCTQQQPSTPENDRSKMCDWQEAHSHMTLTRRLCDEPKYVDESTVGQVAAGTNLRIESQLYVAVLCGHHHALLRKLWLCCIYHSKQTATQQLKET